MVLTVALYYRFADFSAAASPHRCANMIQKDEDAMRMTGVSVSTRPRGQSDGIFKVKLNLFHSSEHWTIPLPAFGPFETAGAAVDATHA